MNADNSGSPAGAPDGEDPSVASLAFVLMAGGFSPPPLAVSVGCAVLDLHLTAEQTVLARWQWAVSTLERAGVAGERLCLCGGSSALPAGTTAGLRMIVDKSDYRGPAGALRDACERMGPETTIIAAEAARCCTIDLARMLAWHRRSGADVTVARNGDESPAGIYILGRATLDEVPHAGFMDLKEQWLARLVSAGRDVRVHELRGHGALPLRTRAEFIRAMHVCNGHESPAEGGTLEPRVLRGTRRAGSVVCAGAGAAADAVVVDSLVMPGARVGAGALVARSVVGPGCSVREGQEVVDAVLGPAGVTHDRPRGEGVLR